MIRPYNKPNFLLKATPLSGMKFILQIPPSPREIIRHLFSSEGNMAQGIKLERARFCCLICRDLLNDPVTVPCSHSYCMSCIKEHLDKEDYEGIYSCPQCAQTFTQRPVLMRNDMLAFVVEELKKTEVQAAPADLCYAGPEDVACDVCRGKKLKAVKSCLQCFASYCEEHIQTHYEVGPLKKHKLVEASAKIQESICTRHQEVMKLFCRTDQCCICYLCSKDDHKGHDKVSAAAERGEKQRELGLTRKKIQQRIQEKEKDVRLFLEAGRFRKVREKVEQEIAGLRRKEAELEKLSHTEDHTYFLLNYSSLTRLSKSQDPPSVTVRRMRHFEKVTVALTEAKDKLQLVFGDECANILRTITGTDLTPSNPFREPTTRPDFLQAFLSYLHKYPIGIHSLAFSL
uniref:Uncharacterized protein n=1 Tax=Sparus aurata TaxID=8175 RepID=A0A671Z4P7_SPAAU